MEVTLDAASSGDAGAGDAASAGDARTSSRPISGLRDCRSFDTIASDDTGGDDGGDEPGSVSWTVDQCCGLARYLALLASEDDEDLALAASRSWQRHRVTGEILRELDAANLRDMAGGDARLGRVGLRLRLARLLRAFLDAHEALRWSEVVATVPGLIEIHRRHAKKDAVSAAAERTLDVLAGGRTYELALLPTHLSHGAYLEASKKLCLGGAASPRSPAAPPPSPARDAVVPVFMTVLVKKLVELGSEDDVGLICTLIQRPLVYDLATVQRRHAADLDNDGAPDDGNPPYFSIRVNDGESRMEECFELRSSKREAGEIPASSTTFAGKVPLKLYPVFSAHPIHVVAAEAVLELSSFAGRDKRANFPTSKAHISAVFHSFRLIFGRAIISRNGLEAWMFFS